MDEHRADLKLAARETSLEAIKLARDVGAEDRRAIRKRATTIRARLEDLEAALDELEELEGDP